MITVTGKPREEALASLIESLLNHIIEHNLHQERLTVPEAGSETVS